MQGSAGFPRVEIAVFGNVKIRKRVCIILTIKKNMKFFPTAGGDWEIAAVNSQEKDGLLYGQNGDRIYTGFPPAGQ